MYFYLVWNEMQSSCPPQHTLTETMTCLANFAILTTKRLLSTSFFLASRPNTIIFMVNRRIQENVFFITKKRPSARISLADGYFFLYKKILVKSCDFHSNFFLHSSVVVYLRCGGHIVYWWIWRSVWIKQLQEFLKSGNCLWINCVLSGGIFYFEPPCR